VSPEPNLLLGVVASVRRHLERGAIRAAALWGVVAVGSILIVAWVLAGPDGWHQGSDGPMVLDVLLVTTLTVAALLLRRGLARWFAEPPLAESIEVATGVLPGRVRGSLELARSLPVGVSGSLAGLAARRTLGDLNRPPEQLTGRLGEGVTLWTRRGLGALTGVAVVLALLIVLTPARSRGAWVPLSSPLGTMLDPILPPLVVTPGNLEVRRGSDVELSIQAPARASVEVAWQAAGEVARSQVVSLADGRGVHTFAVVSATVEYRVRAPDGAEAGPFTITPVDPLFVNDLTIAVSYPEHTGLPAEELRGDIPPLLLPVGTRLTLEGTASRTLASAGLVRDSTRSVGFDVAGNGFHGTWVPRTDGLFEWFFLDDDGNPAEIQPEPLLIALVPDSAPGVSIPLPGTDTLLPLSLRQPLILEARDDYGLSRLELVAYRVTAFGERHEPVVQGLDLGGTRAALARPLLDLNDWGLLPGDTVRYFARAWDNAPRAQSTQTREYVLRMPDASELRRDAEKQLESVADRLEALAEEAAREAEESRDMEREAAAEGEEADEFRGRPEDKEDLGFQEREELQQALEDQQQLTAEVDSMRAELEALERAMSEAGQADPELRRDLEELQELLKEINTEEMKERMEELAQSLEQQDMEDANEAMKGMAEQQQEFRDRLEESLERFRRAAVEQDFRATQSEAEELAQQERALADAMREEDDPELRARQQELLEERAKELTEQMERLQERLEKLEEQDAAEGVQEARQQAEQARSEMSEAQQQAQQGQNQEAGEEADQAAEEMEKAAEALQEAQQQMAQQKAQAFLEAMQQAADDALSLARRQSEIQEQMSGASQEQLAAMRADEAALLQGVRNLADNLQEKSEGALSQNREMSVQMGRAMESLQRTVEAMERRRGTSPAPSAAAEQAVADLNQMALMAMAAADQMGQQSEGQPQSGDDVSEQLEQLAQQQGELFNQTGQLMPLQLGEQAMEEQLQEMAEEQQDVAEDLGEMSDDPGAEEEALGDLSDLAEEALALAQQMAQGRLTPDLVQRQERLFHRLLDAGRSLEREEFSDEREAEEVGAFQRGEVVPLTAEQMGALRYSLPDADQLRRLSPAVRQLVIQYFERINRGGGGS